MRLKMTYEKLINNPLLCPLMHDGFHASIKVCAGLKIALMIDCPIQSIICLIFFSGSFKKKKLISCADTFNKCQSKVCYLALSL